MGHPGDRGCLRYLQWNDIQHAEAMKAMGDMIYDPDPNVACTAVDVISGLHRGNQPKVIAALHPAREHPNERVRKLVLDALLARMTQQRQEEQSFELRAYHYGGGNPIRRSGTAEKADCSRLQISLSSSASPLLRDRQRLKI